MSVSRGEDLDSLFRVKLPPRPYPGLRPFEKDEWPIFFGRERMADAVVARLIAKRVLVVHGDSGCGKSSLVRAAVLPRLEQESARGGIHWRTCAAIPGESPLWSLAEALAVLAGGQPGEETAIEIRRVLNFGSGAPGALAEVLRRDPGEHICILIDQFEEVFAHAGAQGPDEAQLLTDFLTALFTEPPEGFYAVLTMRSEFLGACARFDGLAEMVNATQYLLPRMRHDDLLRAIREPAVLYEGEVTRELAERLIAEAGGGQDQLPLIQHGLMLLHRNLADAPGQPVDSKASLAASGSPAAGAWRLGLAHYKHGGGLKGLLSDHADAVMLEAQRTHLASHRESRLIEDLFRALTDINAEGQAIRRRRTLAQLAAVAGAGESTVRSVVDAFRAEGVSFLRPYGNEPIQDQDVIDISHEALIRCWQKIADPKNGWLIREFRNGLVWRALLVQADSFERDPTNVLAPTTTDEREQWLRRRNKLWAERYGGGFERVQALLTASGAARDRERAAQSAARAREQESKLREQQLKWALGGGVVLIVLLALASGLAWYAYQESQRADQEVELERTARNDAQTQAEYEQQARKRSDDLAQEARRSAQELLKIVDELSGGTSGAGSTQTTRSAARGIKTLANNLSSAAGPSRSGSAGAGPRVYIHITGEGQRSAARELERALEASEIDGAKVIVPGIELVNASLGRAVLRCFVKEECNTEGPLLAQRINRLLREPQVTLQDLSARYANTTSIRPRHFEVWFTTGDIALRTD